MKDIIKVTFPSKSANEAFARSIIAAFALRLDPTIDELNDLKGAVSEAVTNVVVHAYPDHIGSVEMTLRANGNTISITIKDKGIGMDDVKKAMEPMFTTGGNDGEERAGLGFAVMENFTDKVTVKSKKGSGTSITLVKKIKIRL